MGQPRKSAGALFGAPQAGMAGHVRGRLHLGKGYGYIPQNETNGGHSNLEFSGSKNAQVRTNQPPPISVQTWL